MGSVGDRSSCPKSPWPSPLQATESTWSLFIAFDRRRFLQQIRIPGFTESNGLRKLRSRQRLKAAPLPAARAAVGNAVQTLDVSRTVNSQAWNIGRRAERADLFFQGHQGEDVADSSFNGQVRILERIRILLSPSEARGQQNEGKG